VAATNQDPPEAVRQQKLREDLFYRLNVFAIRLPPLRDRMDDVPLLVDTFIREFNARNGRSVAGITDAAMRSLERHEWPGNVRELRNVIERATIVARGSSIDLGDLPDLVPVSATGGAPAAASTGGSSVASGSAGLTPGTTVDEAERRLIDITLAHT